VNGQNDDVEVPGRNEAAEPGVTGLRMMAPRGDPEEEGGDPVCWAHLVCEECGAVTTEGHRDWCSRESVRPSE
jgi:hypothetical protein